MKSLTMEVVSPPCTTRRLSPTPGTQFMRPRLRSQDHCIRMHANSLCGRRHFSGPSTASHWTRVSHPHTLRTYAVLRQPLVPQCPQPNAKKKQPKRKQGVSELDERTRARVTRSNATQRSIFWSPIVNCDATDGAGFSTIATEELTTPPQHQPLHRSFLQWLFPS